MALPRYLAPQVERDLRRKMVFVGGARQVGKTTLALDLLSSPRGYMNWDVPEHRERILKRELPPTSTWVFDELHKYRAWRNYLKGLYDAPRREKKRILVTGSARLDLYRRGGDSLQGRYHYLRLHPFSVAELGLQSASDFRDLLELGGFPEPFLGGSKREASRWSREYRTRLIREDVVSLEQVHDLGGLELLMLRLPELVGSPLSINALREDLNVSHKTASHWIAIFERLYAVFRLSPFGAPRIRAVKKEQKHYHTDWSLVRERSLRFENLVASHLLKWVHFEMDSQGRDLELGYFRDVTGREVDFIVTEERKPILLIESKWSDAEPSPHLR
ncbi:MAG: ATP-binding protein, partial [Vicinamibacteria bacterium]